MPAREIAEARLGAILHDVGQMSVPRGGGLSSGVSDDRGDERHGGDCQVAKPAKGESCDGISFEK